jgi:hypothetical protein
MVRKEEKARENWTKTNTAREMSMSGNRGISDLSEETRRTRTIQVPYTKTVRVPVHGTGLVKVTVNKPVAKQKLVEVPTYKDVRQQYTVTESRPAVRQKEIWVKKTVPEKYMKQVEVPRTRIVRVPSMQMKEVDGYTTQTVTEGRPMSVEGYRIDEILPDGTRLKGGEVYHPDDDRVRNIALDSRPPSRVAGRAISSGSNRRTLKNPPKQLTRSLKQRSAKISAIPTVGLGLRLKTATGSRRGGVRVQNVGHVSACERAGITKGDVVQYINNRPVRSVDEFNAVLAASSGPLHVTVERGGESVLQRLKFTVVR